MALGANAVYLAEAALIAMSYSQWDKVPPGTAPSELFLSFGDHQDLLDIEEGTRALTNFIKASTSEMAMLTGLVGKNDVKKVNIDDLVALNEQMSKATGARPAWQ
jgi:glutamate synthase domain-containing protein 2